jgi:hypothetical protein
MFNAIMAITIPAVVFGLLAVAFFVSEWARFIVGTVLDEHRGVRRI